MGIFELEMRDGIQLFPIDYNVLDDISIKNRIKYIKIVIKEAYGGNKTYINQIMFYENNAQEILDAELNNSEDNLNNINLPEDLSNSQISEGEDIRKSNKENKKVNKIQNNLKNTEQKNQKILFLRYLFGY